MLVRRLPRSPISGRTRPGEEALRSPAGEPSAGPAVLLRGVTKEFGAGDAKVPALRGVDLELPYGRDDAARRPERVRQDDAHLSIVAGLLDPTAGRVEVLGRDLTRMGGAAKVRVPRRATSGSCSSSTTCCRR